MRLSHPTRSSNTRVSFCSTASNKCDSMDQVLSVPNADEFDESTNIKTNIFSINNQSRRSSYEEENDKSKCMLLHHINESNCDLFTNSQQCLRQQQEILLQMQYMKADSSKTERVEKQVENQCTDIVIDLSKNSIGKAIDPRATSSIRNVGCVTQTISSVVSSSLNQVKQITSIDGFFNRKRGRPPKNRFVEVYKNTQQTPQAIFTSFKLQKYGLDAIATSSQEAQLGENQEAIGDKNNKCAVERFNDNQTKNKKCVEKASLKEKFFLNSKILIPTESRHISQESNEKFAVVRATGTFFPENKKVFNMCFKRLLANRKTKLSSTKQKTSKTRTSFEKNSAKSMKKYFDSNSNCQNDSIFDEKDLPEDLSINNKTKINPYVYNYQEQSTMNEDSTEMKEIECYPPMNLRLQQLVQVYYQHCLQQKQLKVSVMPSTGQFEAFEGSNSASNRKSLIANSHNIYEMNSFLRTVSSAVAAIAAIAPENAVKNQTKAVTECEELLKIRSDKVPIGYVKFRFNEDCGVSRCTYRKHQTHFHCNRNDCCYSFCDKTRYATHSARHERLDSLMGDDFRQYRVHMKCGFINCLFMSNKTNTKKTSHFHCRKCTFICSDTNKVVAHRRLHMKMESIQMAGFRKFTCNENCAVVTVLSQSHCINDNEISKQLSQESSCSYNMKHTHYHCLVCNASVLSRSQFAMHKHKNWDKSATMTTT